MIKYNLIGKKFGKLTVIENLPSVNESRMWKCLCECGNSKVTRTKLLINGDTVTCGCGAKTRALKHGLAGTKQYNVWFAMVNRTTNKKSKDWYLYGGRGIGIDKNWLNFENFWKDMGSKYQEGLYLDRKNNELGYSKDNCRWVDATTQANNTRRNRYITYKNKTLTESQWNRKLGLGKYVIGKRLKRGWTVEKAFTP
jgi:hypothetical protein